mgnify:CR=1 FL=1
MQSSVQLFSVFHQPFITPTAPFVQPIQAGKALAKVDLGFLGDDTGNNISEKNATYSELTVLYWIWKNADRSRFAYWGLVHYRRYFCADVFPGQFTNKRIYHYGASQHLLDKVVNHPLQKKLVQSLQAKDVVMPKLMYSYRKKGITKSIAEHYKAIHIAEHWDVMIAVLKEKYPQYTESLHFFEGSKMSYFNMMIAPWAIWDEYLEWLFAILFEVEKRIGKVEDPYQARVYGFLSERMINLFVYHNKYKVAYYPVAVFGQ